MATRSGRRLFVRLLGGSGTWLVSAGGCSPFYWPERGVAYEPWAFPNPELEPRLRVVHAGLLAASPHNSQPWIFAVEPDRIDVYADAERDLGSVDPFLREMHVGLGCAVENLSIAAVEEGFTGAVSLMPSADERHVASVSVAAGGSGTAPLYDAIPRRHTNRGRYADFELDPGIEDALAQQTAGENLRLVRLTGSGLEAWRSGTVQATKDFVGSELNDDSHTWFRHSADDIAEHRDGLTTDTAGLGAGIRFFGKTGRPIGAEKMGEYWIRSTERVHVETGSGFYVLCCRDRLDRMQQLEAGRAWQRMHLWCAANGVDVHPVNQIIEMADRELVRDAPAGYVDLMAELAPDGWDPQMFFRVGFSADDAYASPRRPVEWVTDEEK